MPPIKHLLFDCDNTLVLSEELAFKACAELANEVLEKKGIPDRYTGSNLIKDFVGQNFRGMLKSLQTKYGFSMSPEEEEDYVDRELGKVVEALEADARTLCGAYEEVQKLFDEKKYGLAVVSSSALSRVVASLKKVGMDKFFPKDHVFSAATSLPSPTTKPDPAIYLHACKVIGVEPGECIAVEDSKSGATAAKNAKIPLIGYVGPYDEDEKPQKRKMLTEECGAIYVMNHWSEFPEAVKAVEAS